MDRKTYLVVAGIIFTLVVVFHLVRVFADWPVIIGDWSVPKWVSWVALIVAGQHNDKLINVQRLQPFLSNLLKPVSGHNP